MKPLEEIYKKINAWRGEKAQPVWNEITETLSNDRPEVDMELPEPEMPDEEPEALFDTERDYWDQLEKYKDAQKKKIEANKRPRK